MDPEKLFQKQVGELADWRGQMMLHIKQLIDQAAPKLTLVWKWGTPVWAGKSNVCALGAFKDHVKVNFFKGAELADPQKLFNSGLDAKTSRSIDLYEGDKIDDSAFTELIASAVSK